MMDLFKEIIPSILQKKTDLSNDEDFNKSYNAYVVNRALSFHLDCVLQSNQMNMNHGLPSSMQYQYLLHSIRGYRRKFQPWQKRELIQDLEIVKEYYQLSNAKAKEALRVLSSDQIQELRNRLDKGGRT